MSNKCICCNKKLSKTKKEANFIKDLLELYASNNINKEDEIELKKALSDNSIYALTLNNIKNTSIDLKEFIPSLNSNLSHTYFVSEESYSNLISFTQEDSQQELGFNKSYTSSTNNQVFQGDGQVFQGDNQVFQGEDKFSGSPPPFSIESLNTYKKVLVPPIFVMPRPLFKRVIKDYSNGKGAMLSINELKVHLNINELEHSNNTVSVEKITESKSMLEFLNLCSSFCIEGEKIIAISNADLWGTDRSLLKEWSYKDVVLKCNTSISAAGNISSLKESNKNFPVLEVDGTLLSKVLCRLELEEPLPGFSFESGGYSSIHIHSWKKGNEKKPVLVSFLEIDERVHYFVSVLFSEFEKEDELKDKIKVIFNVSRDQAPLNFIKNIYSNKISRLYIPLSFLDYEDYFSCKVNDSNSLLSWGSALSEEPIDSKEILNQMDKERENPNKVALVPVFANIDF